MKHNIARLNSLQWRSCLHLKIGFQKDYSLGIHLLPPAQTRRRHADSNKMHLFSNHLTCTALINKAHRCRKPTDLISNMSLTLYKQVRLRCTSGGVARRFIFSPTGRPFFIQPKYKIYGILVFHCLHLLTKPHPIKLPEKWSQCTQM